MNGSNVLGVVAAGPRTALVASSRTLYRDASSEFMLPADVAVAEVDAHTSYEGSYSSLLVLVLVLVLVVRLWCWLALNACCCT